MKKRLAAFNKLFAIRRDFLLPVRVLSVCLVVTSLLVLFIVFGLWRNYQTVENHCRELSNFQALTGKIEFLNEVLTMSAFMASSTGGISWEERYWDYESELEKVLESVSLYSLKYGDEFDVESVKAANEKSVAIEKQLFDLIKKGDRDAALALLESDMYKGIRRSLSGSLKDMQAAFDKHSASHAQQSKSQAYTIIIVAIVALILLVVIWLKVLKVIRRFIHERKLIEKEVHERKLRAENVEKAKSRFLTHMSHAIRTPLTAILGFSEILVDPELNESGRDESIQTIRRNGDHLLNIVNEILDLSKIESGELLLRKGNFLLLDELRVLYSSMKGKTEEKGLDFTIRSEGPVPREINSNPVRLRQILLSLLRNALQFTEAGSISLVVRLSFLENVQHPKLEFFVSDTGVGMGFLEKKQLFLPFSHGYIVPDQKYGGTGLGLIVSQRLAKLLGGDLVLIDSQKKKGSTFKLAVDPGDVSETIVIRNSEFADLPAISETKIKKELSLKKANILLVEDDADTRVLLKHFLSEAGAQVDEAVDGNEAVEKAMDKTYDLVFMDIELPKLDGPQVTKYLRNQDYRGPIVALSAHTMQGEREKCLKVGCNEFLSKPVDPYLLVKTVKRYQKNLSTNGTGPEMAH